MAKGDKIGGPSGFDTEPSSEYSREAIGKQLDAFSEKHGITSLGDRLNIGLNEVAILAFDRTNKKVEDLVESLTDSPEEAEKLYDDLLKVSLEINTQGPWGYTDELVDPKTPALKAWFLLAAAETIGYEREGNLNEMELIEDIMRIEDNLTEAANDPEAYLEKAKKALIEKSAKEIRFDKDDVNKRAPMGEGHAAFLPMAIQGYEAGIVQDKDGWVFVGARREISDELIQSTGLIKEVAPDDRDPNRTVIYFKNEMGQRVIKKVWPGFLVILSRSFDLAKSITIALNEERDVLRVAQEAMGHTRVIQTSEKGRPDEDAETEEDIRKHMEQKGFLRRPEQKGITDEPSESTEISRPREEFYRDMLYIRGMYVFLDALKKLKKEREAENKEVSEYDKKVLSREIWSKMDQKVEELRHVNEVLKEELDELPEDIRSVIDLAGGAGDLGLAITTQLLSRGHEVDRMEIVDPQEGVDDFMHNMIDHLPFRKKLEEIAVHNPGYLQDANITPDSIVVAKHACGTLTDDIIEQWQASDSKMLVAMTCCQGKAGGESARYGFKQKEWARLCKESDMTNVQLQDKTGKELERAKKQLKKGQKAMKTLDMARVVYLRRHGFEARLDITDKFPKGDTIIARRLPKNFMKKVGQLKNLEKKDPAAFEAQMQRIDILAAGGETESLGRTDFGAEWTTKDFKELTRRFVAEAYEEYKLEWETEAEQEELRKIEENKKAKEKLRALTREVFKEFNGRVDQYIIRRAKDAEKRVEGKQIGQLVGAIKNKIQRAETDDPQKIRDSVNTMMEEMGY